MPPTLKDIGGAGYYENPYPFLRRLRQEAPVFWSDRLRRWVITRHDDALRILPDTETFSSQVVPQIPPDAQTAEFTEFANISAHWLFFLDPPEHTRQRARIAPHFSPHAANRYTDFIRQTAANLLANTRNGGDLLKDFAHPLAACVIARLLCDSPDETADFLLWCGEMDEASRDARSPTARRKGLKAITAVTDYLKRKTASANGWPPIIHGIAATSSEIDSATLFAHASVLLFAGVETTQNLLGNTVYTLLSHSGEWKKLRQNSSLAGAAVEESLRFEAPVLGVVRRAVKSLQLRGAQINSGDEMVVMIGAANRDPSVFSSPDNFIINRRDKNHLAFGHGRHYCTGAALARLTARIGLEVLLERRGNMKLAAPASAWRDHDPIVRGLKSLPVKWE
jgi:cytochrome P450